MLKELIVGALHRFKKKRAEDGRQLEDFLKRAQSLWFDGDVRAALQVYKAAAELFPQNAEVMNGLGACYATLGDTQEAAIWFEQAFLLDDSYLPTVINRARAYSDKRQTHEALPLLRHAYAHLPPGSIDPLLCTVYASNCLNNGDATRGVFFQKKAWLSDFDTLRLANGFLFHSSYKDIDEAELAAEHVFWAETKRDKSLGLGGELINIHRDDKRKIRIAYWSPDLRNHSVRYFFRPLLENHDRERFEIYLYQDNHATDAQTALIKEAADFCFDVYELSDDALFDLIKSHDIDILVELAGHTSANRLSMFSRRMARLQVTAIGYPPTTGLQEIDCKIVDPYVAGQEPEKYFAEFPLQLKGSFWCFDPMEDYQVSENTPCRKNGYVTFGHIGNVAKISTSILECWRRILDQVNGARLIVRSISFEDEFAITAFRDRMRAAGLDAARVELFPPLGGDQLFYSYADIDLVLDTYPFNGGTTTCFATYMGAPVVSMYGKSLISRMGLSILSNMGWSELAVATQDEYVDKAVEWAFNPDRAEKFRREARAAYKNTSLGNGKLYAEDFESACVDYLRRIEAGAPSYRHQVLPIDKKEAIRRAYNILSVGNIDAASRVRDYCRKYYPLGGDVLLLEANIIHAQVNVDAAIDALVGSLGKLSGEDTVAALMTLVHWMIGVGRIQDAKEYFDDLKGHDVDDEFDRLQIALFDAMFKVLDRGGLEERSLQLSAAKRFLVICPYQTQNEYLDLQETMLKRCIIPDGWAVEFVGCEMGRRADVIRKASKSNADIVVVLQRHVEVCSPTFFSEIAASLESVDAVGIAGSASWDRTEWRSSPFEDKAAGVVVLTGRDDLTAEVRYWGRTQDRLVVGMTVLDGSAFAVKASSLAGVELDDELVDADFLLEEECLHQLAQNGVQLGVNRGLGVLLRPTPTSDVSRAGAGRLHWLDKHGRDPFVPAQTSDLFVSVLVPDPLMGIEVLKRMVHADQ